MTVSPSHNAGQVREDEADEVASYAGIGIGLTTLLRATPFRLVHDEIPLPIELLPPSFPYGQLFEETPSLSEEEVSLWASAIEQMAATAEAHFYQMRKLQAHISRAARPTLLPVVPARQFLQRLQATQNNLMDAKLHEPQRLSLLLGLGRSWLVGSV
jgi:phytoene/squalene synthetase